MACTPLSLVYPEGSAQERRGVLRQLELCALPLTCKLECPHAPSSSGETAGAEQDGFKRYLRKRRHVTSSNSIVPNVVRAEDVPDMDLDLEVRKFQLSLSPICVRVLRPSRAERFQTRECQVVVLANEGGDDYALLCTVSYVLRTVTGTIRGIAAAAPQARVHTSFPRPRNFPIFLGTRSAPAATLFHTPRLPATRSSS